MKNPALPFLIASFLVTGLQTAPAQYAQPPAHQGGLSADGSNFEVADDFIFPQTTPVPYIAWWGGYDNGPVAPDAFVIEVYSDNGGQPGSLVPIPPVLNITRVPGGSVQDGMSEYYYGAQLDGSFLAQAGTRYWLHIVNHTPVQLGQRWNWELSTPTATPGAQLFYGGAWHNQPVNGTAFFVPEPSPFAVGLLLPALAIIRRRGILAKER